jgi:hypothetical protein
MTTAILSKEEVMQIIINISDDFVPEDGDAFDAVTAALEFAEIPATLVVTKVDAHAAIELMNKANP